MFIPYLVPTMSGERWEGRIGDLGRKGEREDRVLKLILVSIVDWKSWQSLPSTHLPKHQRYRLPHSFALADLRFRLLRLIIIKNCPHLLISDKWS